MTQARLRLNQPSAPPDPRYEPCVHCGKDTDVDFVNCTHCEKWRSEWARETALIVCGYYFPGMKLPARKRA